MSRHCCTTDDLPNFAARYRGHDSLEVLCSDGKARTFWITRIGLSHVTIDGKIIINGKTVTGMALVSEPGPAEFVPNPMGKNAALLPKWTK